MSIKKYNFVSLLMANITMRSEHVCMQKPAQLNLDPTRDDFFKYPYF